MSTRINTPLRVLLIVCAVLAGVVFALQTVLNSSCVRSTVDRLARENIDGTLSYSDIDFSVIGAFPKLRVCIDTLSLTYPHSRFAHFIASDSLSLSGNGEQSDTLLAFDRFSITFSPFRLLFGRVHIDYAAIHSLSLYAHSYNDSTANWRIFRSSGDTASSLGSLPTITVKEFCMDRQPEIVYSDESSKVFADVGLMGLSLRGMLKVYDGNFRMNGLSLRLDAGLKMTTGRFSDLNVPLLADIKASCEKADDSLTLRLASCTANIAHIPLTAEGMMTFRDDSSRIDVRSSIDSLPVGIMLQQYGGFISPILPYFSSDAKLNLELGADGWISDLSLPRFSAKLSIPPSSFDYIPRDMNGRIALECSASSSGGRNLDARLETLSLSVPGTGVRLSGNADDILSDNPFFSGRLKATSSLDKMSGYVLHDAGIDASGNIDVTLDLDAHLKDLDSLHFPNATLCGRLSSDNVSLTLQGNGMQVNAFKPRILLSSDKLGAGLGLSLDSLYYISGENLTTRVRGLSLNSVISKMPYRDTLVTGNKTSLSAESAFFKTETLKAGVRGAKLSMTCRKRPERRRAAAGSPAEHPVYNMSVPILDSAGVPLPPLDDRLVKIRLDSALVAQWHKWSVGGSVRLGKGFFATPVLPLRTRLGGTSLSFDSNSFNLDSLSVVSGSSDLRASGSVSGIRRFSRHRGSLRLDLNLESRRLNLNELISAIQQGSREVLDSAVSAEKNEDFVIDTLENARPERRLRKFLLPPFIDGSVNLRSDDIEYLDLKAQPIRLSVQMYERVLRLSELSSSFGESDFTLDGYYSTQSPDDISIGIDASVHKAPVNRTLRLLRNYDSLSPILRSIEGRVDLEASLTAGIDRNLNLKPSTIDGMARMSGEDILINDVGNFRRITKLLFFKNKNIGKVDDFQVDAILRDGTLEIYPFFMSADRYKLALQGIQGLDGSMNWYASVLKSPFLIPFGVKVYGNFDKCRFGLAAARYIGKKKLPAYTAQLDSVQINVARTIERVYSEGVDRALRYSTSSVGKTSSASVPSDTLSRQELESLVGIDSLSMQHPELQVTPPADSLSRHVSKLPESDSDAAGDADTTPALRLDIDKLSEEFKKIQNGKQ